MDIRLITVKEDFEKAYNILNQREYPLSFYEFTLKHDDYQNNEGAKLLGVFEADTCQGSISYKVTKCPHLGRILEIQEINQTSIKSYKVMMDFLDTLAKEEDCHAIKICKNKVERLNQNIFDRMENFLKRIIH